MEIDSEERPLLAKGPSVNHKRLCSILPCLLLSGALFFGPFNALLVGSDSESTAVDKGDSPDKAEKWVAMLIVVALGLCVLSCRPWWYSFDVEGDTLVVKERKLPCCCARVRKLPVKDIGSLVYTTEWHSAFCGADFTGVYATVGLPQESPKPLEPWETTRRPGTVNVAFQLPLSMTCKEKSFCCAGAGLSDYKRTFYRLQAALGFVPNPAFREYVEAKELPFSHLLPFDQWQLEQARVRENTHETLACFNPALVSGEIKPRTASVASSCCCFFSEKRTAVFV